MPILACLWTTLLLSLFSLQVLAQHKLTGRVSDRKTGEPLAFVNLIANQEVRKGTATDINGYFSIRSSTEINHLTLSYVGYQKLELDRSEFTYTNGKLEIKMQSLAHELEEVTILPGENPAHAIIRKVIANKDRNNPEKIPSFRYQSYNKVIYDLIPTNDKYLQRLSIGRTLKGGHLGLMESVTERKFIAPDKYEEKIIGTKVSGLSHPTFATVATDFQPFSFYKEVIPILDIHYLNPISNGSLKKYDFQLKDTVYKDQDTIYLISFQPLPDKNFEGLSGVLYINTRHYALQNVLAEPTNKGLIDIRIKQQYQWVDQKQWFPHQLDFEILMPNYPNDSVGFSINGKSFINQVELRPELRKRDFALESFYLTDSAGRRSEEFWNRQRNLALNDREVITYQVIDSIGEEINLDGKMNFLEKYVQGRIPVYFVDIDLNRTLLYNKFEGTRLGLGLYTNEKVLKFAEVGGFFGWGTKDKLWKYGGDLNITLNKENEIELGGRYHYNVIETGVSGLRALRPSLYDLRAYMASRMDRVEQREVSLGFRTARYAKVKLSLNQTDYQPLYDYQYQTDEAQPITDYTQTSFSINLRYTHKEKLVESMNQRVSLGSDYPTLFVSATQGLKGTLDGDLDMTRVEVAIQDDFYTKNLGQTRITLTGGMVEGDLPYGQLFTGEGSLDNDLLLVTPNTFQTIKPYEFLSDRYARLFFSHNFGTLLFRTEKFAPNVVLQQNIGFGTLSNRERHLDQEFRIMDQGLYESGLVLENLVRIKYLDIAYIGIGAGVFYRYGPYSEEKSEDNLAAKFTVSISSK